MLNIYLISFLYYKLLCKIKMNLSLFLSIRFPKFEKIFSTIKIKFPSS